MLDSGVARGARRSRDYHAVIGRANACASGDLTMRWLYVVHIVTGSIGLLSGYVALFVTKGGRSHRRSGKIFVYVMLAMALAGLLIAALRGVAPALNIPAALLTAYLVVTALTTVRRGSAASKYAIAAGLLWVLAVSAACLTFAAQAIANGGVREGMPAFPFVMFGVVGLLASIGDARVLRAGPRHGPARLARHLWRMCFALFIAALSFFIGQAQVIPKPIRILPLLAMPVVVVLFAMFYWLWRIRVKRKLHGIAGITPYGVTT